MLELIKRSPNYMYELISLSQLNEEPLGWRATWILRQCADDNSSLLKPFLSRIIGNLSGFSASHQREWLKALNNQNIEEDDLGLLFELCVGFWLNIHNHSALRVTACLWLLKISALYPDLKTEVKMLLQEDYLALLTPGIRNSLDVEIKKHKLG